MVAEVWQSQSTAGAAPPCIDGAAKYFPIPTKYRHPGLPEAHWADKYLTRDDLDEKTRERLELERYTDAWMAHLRYELDNPPAQFAAILAERKAKGATSKRVRIYDWRGNPIDLELGTELMSSTKLTQHQNDLIAQALCDHLSLSHHDLVDNEAEPLGAQLKELPQIRAALTRQFLALNRATEISPTEGDEQMGSPEPRVRPGK